MAKTLTVGNQDFLYPENKENPGWGEEATSWAERVTALLATLSGANDIALTNFPAIENGQTTSTDITGLAFDPTLVRAATISYIIVRTIDGGTDRFEYGEVNIVRDTEASQWLIQREFLGTSGVVLTIDDTTGQFEYTSDTVVGTTNYVGFITFKATTIPVSI